jgi:protein involved in ribonucleotide reduction
MEAWTQVISTVGFPIACVIGLGYFVYIIYKNMTTENEKREDKLYELVTISHANNEKLVAVNQEFVKVLETYKTDISDIKHDIEDIKEIIVKEN